MRLQLHSISTHLPLRKLFRTQTMQNALVVLQLSNQELNEWLIHEIDKNPVLESPRRSNTLPLSEEIADPISLYRFLDEQIPLHFHDLPKKKIAKEIIGSLDEKGFFSIPLDSLFVNVPIAKEVLSIVQKFNPPGIAARNLQECLLLQLQAQGKEKTLSYMIISQFYDDLLHKRFFLLERRCQTKESEIKSDLERNVKPLYTAPASIFENSLNSHGQPEIEIDEKGIVTVYSDYPRIELSKNYQKLLKQSPSAKCSRWIQEWIAKSSVLQESVERRIHILKKLASYLLKKQKKFFFHDSPISPLSIRECAESLEIHESTLRRILDKKTLTCTKGTYALRNFFPLPYKQENFSQKIVQEKLIQIIEKENKKKPYTDEALKDLLKGNGISISRRCVTKYRKKLKIGSRSQRKKTIL